MLKIILATAAAVSFVGCKTTDSGFSEPSRSYYYSSCLGAGIMATTCQCMEAAAIEKTEITNIEKTSDIQKQAIMEALHNAQEVCDAKTRKLIEENK